MDTVIVQPMGTPLIKIMQEQLGKPNIAIFNHVKSINCPFHLIGMTVMVELRVFYSKINQK